MASTQGPLSQALLQRSGNSPNRPLAACKIAKTISVLSVHWLASPIGNMSGPVYPQSRLRVVSRTPRNQRSRANRREDRRGAEAVGRAWSTRTKTCRRQSSISGPLRGWINNSFLFGLGTWTMVAQNGAACMCKLEYAHVRDKKNQWEDYYEGP